MKKVLVAVDGSDKSLEATDYAMSIANKERAQLIILNVLDTEPWFYGQSAYRWATEDVLRKVYAQEILEREKILAKIKEKAEKLNIQSKTEVLMSPQTTSTAASYSKLRRGRSYHYRYARKNRYHKNAAW